MTKDSLARQPGEQWSAADGVHIEVRGLAAPAPFVQIIQLLESLSVPCSIIVHHDRDPLPLYDELAQRGWSAQRIAGDAGIVGLLQDEHDAIRAVAQELLPLTGSAAAGTLDAAGWDALKRGALEMVERQVAHIQKEEMALLPILDDLLDDETDRQLAFDYAAS